MCLSLTFFSLLFPLHANFFHFLVTDSHASFSSVSFLHPSWENSILQKTTPGLHILTQEPALFCEGMKRSHLLLICFTSLYSKSSQCSFTSSRLYPFLSHLKAFLRSWDALLLSHLFSPTGCLQSCFPNHAKLWHFCLDLKMTSGVYDSNFVWYLAFLRTSLTSEPCLPSRIFTLTSI